MLCTSLDFVQVATCTKSLYRLQLVQAVCSSNPNFYSTDVQVEFKKNINYI